MDTTSPYIITFRVIMQLGLSFIFSTIFEMSKFFPFLEVGNECNEFNFDRPLVCSEVFEQSNATNRGGIIFI